MQISNKAMTIDELIERLNEIKVTGKEVVCLEVNGQEYVLARHVFRDDGDLIISNVPNDD